MFKFLKTLFGRKPVYNDYEIFSAENPDNGYISTFSVPIAEMDHFDDYVKRLMHNISGCEEIVIDRHTDGWGRDFISATVIKAKSRRSYYIKHVGTSHTIHPYFTLLLDKNYPLYTLREVIVDMRDFK